jgi:hypothetical protein
LSEAASHVVLDLIVAECKSAAMLFSDGEPRSSSIFNDSVVSPDVIPAGLFIMVAGKQFGTINSSTLPLCVHIMCQASAAVIDAILIPVACRDGSVCDPRCSIAEAWFTCLAAMAATPACANDPDPRVGQLFVDSVVGAISLIFAAKADGKEQGSDGANGMSMDGPQSMALMDFLSAFLALGPSRLEQLAVEISRRFPIPIQGDASSTGLAILVAALFRAIQGSLPPWTLEMVPAIFSNLYFGLGKRPQIFSEAIKGAMELRLPPSSPAVGGLEPGQLLSNVPISDVAKEDFRRQAVDLAEADNHAGWKRLKHCVKAICGGKRKETEFCQKPSLTRWEFERI